MRTIHFKDENYLFLPYNIFGFHIHNLSDNKKITFIGRTFQFQTMFLNVDISLDDLYYVISYKEFEKQLKKEVLSW